MAEQGGPGSGDDLRAAMASWAPPETAYSCPDRDDALERTVFTFEKREDEGVPWTAAGGGGRGQARARARGRVAACSEARAAMRARRPCGTGPTTCGVDPAAL